ncbi:hypothetical protein AAF712_003977 [Marasmius tenuissimus]|uniref:Protein kinase domain-containing protein n=1 Tax=Marasmius tenuissimus TaxID=585030 RepID=A0ABR3A6M5_9AGAR
MCDYGGDLFLTTAYSSWARERLCGTTIHNIATQLCEAITFLHSYGFFRLDIKPHNLAFDHSTSRLAVIDLRSSMHGDLKNSVIQAMDKDDSTPSPPLYDPRRADVWAIGNVISVLLYSDVEQVDYGAELVEFNQWLM